MVVDGPHWLTALVMYGPMPDGKCGIDLPWMSDANGDCWSVVNDGCSILDVNTWKMSSSLTLAWDLFLKGSGRILAFTEK